MLFKEPGATNSQTVIVHVHRYGYIVAIAKKIPQPLQFPAGTDSLEEENTALVRVPQQPGKELVIGHPVGTHIEDKHIGFVTVRQIVQRAYISQVPLAFPHDPQFGMCREGVVGRAQ